MPTDPTNWKQTPEVLRQHLTPKTRQLQLCSPSNPTGIVYSEAELRALADVIRDTDAYVMVDEIYARISYVPVGRWLRAAPDLADRTIIIDGVSKAYAMTGWRLGWMVGPKDVVASCNALQSQLTSHPSAVSQQAALAALKHNPEVEQIVDAMVKTFRERRDAIVDGLQGIPGLTCPHPDGAFYVYPDVRGLLGRPLGESGYVAQTSKDVAAYLLDQTFTSTVPGEAFGTPGFLRLSYALSMESLQEGCARIRKALA
jgi:aspartate aminotransferase